jgi:opacity protein-like surface antigen
MTLAEHFSRVVPAAVAATVLWAPSFARAQGDVAPPASTPSTAEPTQAPSPPPPSAEPQAEKPSEPFAFGDFTWLNGSNRQTKALLDTPYFTPEFLLDVNYTASTNRPIDNTVVGSTALSRNNEVTLQFLGVGGDFHYGAARARLMTQFGMRSVVVPRNDFSSFKGQYDLQTALRYVSEAYGGVHIDALHGINIDAGIFMSYVGLFSYDNFENWMYLPSYTSDNTPWFFNGVRVQVFTSDKFKVEPWIINGWQTYGKFNEMPGFGAQLLWRPVEWLSLLSNDYVGWDTANTPGRMRFHSDNSALVRYYHDPNNHIFNQAAFSLTADIGGEVGNGVTAFGGKSTDNPAECTASDPCTQQFLSAMAYNRLWFFDKLLAFTVGGGMMHNPGRYLVLAPTGQAASVPQPLGAQGIQYISPSAPFSTSPGTKFDAWDLGAGFQYMPTEQITYDLEFSRRAANVPYFAGHGGVTSPDGYVTTSVPPGWRPDLVKTDLRVIAALLVRF